MYEPDGDPTIVGADMEWNGEVPNCASPSVEGDLEKAPLPPGAPVRGPASHKRGWIHLAIAVFVVLVLIVPLVVLTFLYPMALGSQEERAATAPPIVSYGNFHYNLTQDGLPSTIPQSMSTSTSNERHIRLAMTPVLGCGYTIPRGSYARKNLTLTASRVEFSLCGVYQSTRSLSTTPSPATISPATSSDVADPDGVLSSYVDYRLVGESQSNSSTTTANAPPILSDDAVAISSLHLYLEIASDSRVTAHLISPALYRASANATHSCVPDCPPVGAARYHRSIQFAVAGGKDKVEIVDAALKAYGLKKKEYKNEFLH